MLTRRGRTAQKLSFLLLLSSCNFSSFAASTNFEGSDECFLYKLEASRPEGRYTSGEIVRIFLKISRREAITSTSWFALHLNGQAVQGYESTQISRETVQIVFSLNNLPPGQHVIEGLLHHAVHPDQLQGSTVVEELDIPVWHSRIYIRVVPLDVSGPSPGIVDKSEIFLHTCLSARMEGATRATGKRPLDESTHNPSELLVPETVPAAAMKGEGGVVTVDPCWWVLQKQAFSRPVYMTRQELSFMDAGGKEPSRFCEHDITPKLRAKFPSRSDVSVQKVGLGTCAVVGNAGHLLGSGLGAQIDAHDSVLRINRAPTRGFEVDVGSRTTHRFLNADTVGEEYMSKEHQAHNSSFVLVVIPHKCKRCMAAYLDMQDQLGADFVRMISVAFLQEIWSVWSQTDDWLAGVPTTGLVSVIYALHLCSRIDTYGFGHSPFPESNKKYAYFSPDDNTSQRSYAKPYSGHRFGMEDDVMNMLMSAGAIRRVYREEQQPLEDRDADLGGEPRSNQP